MPVSLPSAGPLAWIARLTGLAAVVTLLAATFGEPGPASPQEWLYLAFFPFGFSAGYLLGWRWPRAGGAIALCCLVISQIVTGRTFDLHAYAVWAVLAVPGILFLIAGTRPGRV